jgi:N-acetylmuramoyl-L-alanine amidase
MHIVEDFIPISKYTRPGIKLKKLKALVIHWTGRSEVDYKHWMNFYEERAKTGSGYGSAHLFVENNGNVYNIIPLNEVAWHVGSKVYTRYAMKRFDINKNKKLEWSEVPNHFTIGIELRPMNNWSCEFSDTVFEGGVKLLAYLCKKYGLNPFNDILTHHMITGKKCPYWFVKHPEDFMAFKELVAKNIKF